MPNGAAPSGPPRPGKAPPPRLPSARAPAPVPQYRARPAGNEDFHAVFPVGQELSEHFVCKVPCAFKLGLDFLRCHGESERRGETGCPIPLVGNDMRKTTCLVTLLALAWLTT